MCSPIHVYKGCIINTRDVSIPITVVQFNCMSCSTECNAGKSSILKL